MIRHARVELGFLSQAGTWMRPNKTNKADQVIREASRITPDDLRPSPRDHRHEDQLA